MSNNFEMSCVVCTLHEFLSSKVDLCRRALLLDHILAMKKTTRTPRVHLVIFMNDMKLHDKVLTHKYIDDITLTESISATIW